MATLSPIGAQDQLEHIHDDRVPEMLASQIICFIVALVAVVVRLLSRKLGRVPIKAEYVFQNICCPFGGILYGSTNYLKSRNFKNRYRDAEYDVMRAKLNLISNSDFTIFAALVSRHSSKVLK